MDLSELLGRRRGVVGVDVQPDSLRLVALAGKSMKDAKLVAAHVQALPPGLVFDDRIENIPAVAEQLRIALRSMGVRSKAIAMALPALEVVRRPLRVDKELTEEDLQYQVEAEVQGPMGLSLEDVNVDYAPLPDDEDVTAQQLMVAAANKNRVQDFQALAEEAGLKLTILDAADLALDRAFRLVMDPKETGLQVLLHIQHRETHLIALHNGEMVHEGAFSLGETQLAAELAEKMKWEPQKAGDAVAKQLWPASAADRVVRPFVDQLVHAVDAELSRFYANSPFHRAATIQVAGPLATLPGLKEQLAGLCTKGCKIMNPFETIAVTGKAAKAAVRQVPPASAVAMGLAMRSYL